MSFIINTQCRSNQAEIMDDFSHNGELLRDTLDKLSGINKWLGGNQVTLNGLKKLLRDHPKDKPLTLIDLGCGSGDIVREVAKFGNKEGYNFKIIGVDANKDTIFYAKELSTMYPDINYLHCNIFSVEFDLLEYDIVISNLFIHHFKDDQIIEFVPRILKKTSLGIIVNDLHRHPMAYYLFRLLCIAIPNNMVKEDGLTSVLRGFKRKELENLSTKISAKYQIKWKWAFRYQWIIQKK